VRVVGAGSWWRFESVTALPTPGRVMYAYQTSHHPPVAVAHAFVIIRPTTGVDTSAHAICGLILTLRRVFHCFCR
jgi:hypothetical protein